MKRLSKQNFDDLIRERFDGYEQNPPDYIRDRIKQSMKSQGSAGNGSSAFFSSKWMLSGILLVAVSGLITLGVFGFDSGNTDLIAENTELLNAIESPETQDNMSVSEFESTDLYVESESPALQDKDVIRESQENAEETKIVIEERTISPELLIELKAFAGSDKSVCGLECTLNASKSHEKANGKWSYQGPGKIEFNSTKNPKASIKASDHGVYNLVWTESFKNAESSDMVTVEFLKSGDMSVTGEVINATCHDSNGSVEVIVEGGDGTYNYYWDNENIPGDSYRDNLPAGEYNIKVVDGHECQANTSVVVEDKGIVKPAFVHKELTLSIDVPVYFLNSTKVDGISFEDLGTVMFTWNFGDGSLSDIAEPEHIYKMPGSYKVKMFATSAEGCKDSTFCLIVIDNENVQYVNVFTPNGDNINDVFYVNVKYLEEFECVIMNRYGREIYKWSDPEKGWDGKLEDGSYAKPGTYYYFIKGIDKNKMPYNYQNFFMLSR